MTTSRLAWLALAAILAAAPLAATAADGDIAGVSAEEAERIRQQVKTRRGMMNAHQAISIALIPTLGATAAMGTINRLSLDTGAGVTPAMLGAHRALAISSAAMYVTTGILALAAPHPMRNLLTEQSVTDRADSSKIHARLAIIHASVFAALLVTGIIDARAPMSAEAYAVVNKIHLVEGWTMFALVTISGITIARF